MMVDSLPQPVGRQREVLVLPAEGHTVVLGTAGSGKTTLAILRSLYLSHPKTDHRGPTLLVTFNKCLVTYMRHLAGELQRPVTVENYHKFARGYLSARGKLPWGSICNPDERTSFIHSAIKRAEIDGLSSAFFHRPIKFWDEEFEWIQKQGITDKQEYVAAERIGRTTTRVQRKERAAVFNLYELYLNERCRGGKLYDWSDLATNVREELQQDESERRYRHVVIDEGQDFSPEMLRSLAIAIPENGSLTFYGDIAQQIYGHRVSWRNAGLFAKSVWQFEENCRNTQQITRLALALTKMPYFPGDPDLVEPKKPIADGPLPALRRLPNEQEERQFVISRATRLAQTGTVAILFRARDQEWNIPSAERLHRDLNQWPSGPGLFFGTYHAAKGLEFDTVFLPLLSIERWPDPSDVELLGDQEAATRNGRLLYVGVTRAKSSLVLTYAGKATTLLPNDSELYQ